MNCGNFAESVYDVLSQQMCFDATSVATAATPSIKSRILEICTEMEGSNYGFISRSCADSSIRLLREIKQTGQSRATPH